MGQITSTLTKWCDNCDDILACIETQVVRANSIKEAHLEHKSSIDKEVSYQFSVNLWSSINAGQMSSLGRTD